MKIVQISSGLGNQMFQYALYIYLKNEGFNSFIDSKTNYNLSKQHNGYELEKVFHIKPKEINEKMIKKYRLNKESLIDKLLKKIAINTTYYKEKREFIFDKTILKKKNEYLKGYWQSYKYIEPVENIIKEQFQFKIDDFLLNEVNKKTLSNILKTNSISVHVRRGDYYQGNNINKFGNITTLKYYEKAFKKISTLVENPHYFIFSDDIEWCKKNLKEKNIHYVDANKKENSFIDMYLMSKCDHNIIANSSFSWWGAFLNSHEEKIIIAPSKWLHGQLYEETEIVPNEWIKIDENGREI
ncbi:alpha-1,2-fucosyltransferase [Exiguobacterium acetylicum]|uniref:alpha-1,2-fucosyltransferase n=1 Tax=Exiguobacterium acetylicum TaxID=41170 RepID=UPI0039776955